MKHLRKFNEGFDKDPNLEGIYVKRCKCGARPYLDRVASAGGGQWIACNCGAIGESGITKEEAIDNWNNGNIEHKTNEARKTYPVGTYRDKAGNMHSKFRDDENYIFIKVNHESITIEGDGQKKSQDEIYKEIEEAKAAKPNKYQMMSDAEFRKHMKGI